MADNVAELIENEVCTKKKEVVDSPIKEKSAAADEKPEKENGNVCEGENGKADEPEEEVDAKVSDDAVCPVKRKSTGGSDAKDETAKDDSTPEKKAKLDEALDAESNGEAKVAT